MDQARATDLPEVEVFDDVPEQAEFACASEGVHGRGGVWLLADRIVLLGDDARQEWPLESVVAWSTRSDGDDFVLRLVGDGAGEVHLAAAMRVPVLRALQRVLGVR